MPYCVHCGVELDADVKRCPLCGVEVKDPKAEKNETEPRWSDREDHPRARVKKRSLALLTALMLLIPIGICIYRDYATDGALTWSLIVTGGVVLLFIVLFSPFLFKNDRPFLSVLIDGFFTALYVLLIAYSTGGDWLLPVGVPLGAAAFLIALILTFIFTRVKHMGVFAMMGSILIACGLYTVGVEWAVSAYLGIVETFPGWSVYVSIPSVLAGLMAFVLNASPAMKERIMRRFFI